MTDAGRCVSVIIPVFNSEPYLAEAVDSVRRQDCAHLELIIADDGSADDTVGVVPRLQDGLRYVYYVNQGNGSPARARSCGPALARGGVIVFLDADDLWPPRQVGAAPLPDQSHGDRRAADGRESRRLPKNG
ncbi:MAG TPA: glycosyltransferase family A protein [bacterium]|nr:glycosyltransferase family A protein [bacterium]